MNEIDPLYRIFEKHLLSSFVEEETADAFLVRVVTDYIERLVDSGTLIPREHMASVEADLKDEVLEMLRKKTYGHFNLNEFRKAQGMSPAPIKSVQQKKKQRGRSRAC